MESVFKLSLHVSAWEAWAGPELSRHSDWENWASHNPSWNSERLQTGPVPAMPPIHRRRADASDRLGLEVAFRLAPPGSDIPTVFASRHGQLARSVTMLMSQATGEAASPMDFSLSVHNAIAGQYAISSGNRSPSNSIASRDESFSSALMEAQGLIAEGHKQVLAVMSDLMPPGVLTGRWNGEPGGYALGLMLVPDGGEAFDMELSQVSPGTESYSDWPQALVFLKSLAGGQPEACWSREGRRWTWSWR